MKALIAGIIIGIGVMVPGLALAADPVPVGINQIFSPEGFDDNDNAQVVIDGWLSSTCDHMAEPKVAVYPDKMEIEVVAMKVRGDIMCLPLEVRFSQVINLGPLAYGKWNVVSNNGWLIDVLSIEEASNSGPDDYLYAHLDELEIDFDPDASFAPSGWSVVLHGQFLNSCERWDEVKVINSGDSLEILPKIKNASPDLECAQVIERFKKRVYLPDYFDKGRYLVHARSRGGNALNELFSVR